MFEDFRKRPPTLADMAAHKIVRQSTELPPR